MPNFITLIRNDEKEPDIIDPEAERLDKLLIYYKYFDVEKQYGIDFKTFVRRVDEGTWTPYLAS